MVAAKYSLTMLVDYVCAQHMIIGGYMAVQIFLCSTFSRPFFIDRTFKNQKNPKI